MKRIILDTSHILLLEQNILSNWLVSYIIVYNFQLFPIFILGSSTLHCLRSGEDLINSLPGWISSLIVFFITDLIFCYIFFLSLFSLEALISLFRLIEFPVRNNQLNIHLVWLIFPQEPYNKSINYNISEIDVRNEI